MSQLKLIETERLILNDIEQADAHAVFELFSNNDVLQFYDVKKFTSINQAYALINKMHDRFKNQQGYRYAIRLKSGKLIGSFGVNKIIETNGQYGVLIGYDLHPEYWHQGLMSEVLRRILLQLKENSLFSKRISFVIAEVYAENVKSIQLLLKHGFLQTELTELNVDQQIDLNLEMASRLIFKHSFC
ncbi:GNAT family N-acetyltransferase [Acinetobacter sp. P8-3-8]|uniref:GNAT family N-acetyltransferase n=1 Tax=Acinetobacter sp. P8-3-8 TaxID=1029823 RepID=UPI00030FD6F0|nr:GNAT family N-acetyltransferase [Acinetobacter sp. P8-3-8]